MLLNLREFVYGITLYGMLPYGVLLNLREFVYGITLCGVLPYGMFLNFGGIYRLLFCFACVCLFFICLCKKRFVRTLFEDPFCTKFDN